MFSSRVLQCQVLYWYLNLQAIWSLFLCMVCVCVCVCVLNSLTNMQLSSFPNTTCQRDCVFSVYTLASFVEDYLTIGVWVYLYTLYSVPLIHMSLFVQILCCCGYYSFAVLSEIWEDSASSRMFRTASCSFSSRLLWHFWVFYCSI